jgi:hypothetical protein
MAHVRQTFETEPTTGGKIRSKRVLKYCLTVCRSQANNSRVRSLRGVGTDTADGMLASWIGCVEILALSMLLRDQAKFS